MRGSYYSEVASRLLIALSSEADEATTLPRAARLACDSLRLLKTDLGPDGELRWAINHLNGLTASQAAQVQQALAVSTELFEVFLVVEISALREAGMPANVVDLVRSQAREAALVAKATTPNADQLLERVRMLCETVCALAEEAKQIERIREAVKGAVHVLAGASTIGINASVDAVTTLGLAPWMTAISGAVGGGLILKPFSRKKK